MKESNGSKKALLVTLDIKVRTYDMGGTSSSLDMAEAVAARL